MEREAGRREREGDKQEQGQTWDALEDSEVLRQTLVEAEQNQHDLTIAMEVIVKLQEENRVLVGQVKGLLLQTANLKAAAMRVVGAGSRASPARQRGRVASSLH